MDLSSAWSFYQQHKDKAGYAIAGLLLLAAGYQWGRVTSPYYAAHPIIFQNAPGEVASSSGGSLAELEKLRQAGQELNSETAATGSGGGEGSPPNPSPAVAAAGQFVGSKNSDLYHALTCSTWKRIKPENQVWFQSREEAEAAGYKPTKCTAQALGL